MDENTDLEGGHQMKTLTIDSWLGRALANMPAPTGKPLDGWRRFEPGMRGFRYERHLEDGRDLYVIGGPRKGWRWSVYPPHDGSPRNPTTSGYAEHLDYAMTGAEQADTLPEIVTLSVGQRVEYEPGTWDVTFSGSINQGTACVLATHVQARQTYSIGCLEDAGSGMLGYGARYITEMSMFYPIKDHRLVYELGREAIAAYLYEIGLTKANGHDVDHQRVH